MDEIHRQVIKKNGPFLVKEVILDDLWPHLLAREIFTDAMIEHIQATGARSSQISRLLSDLTRRGPNAYSEFLECLAETEQHHIVDKLNKAEEVLRNKEPKYFQPSSISRNVPVVVSKHDTQDIKPVINGTNLTEHYPISNHLVMQNPGELFHPVNITSGCNILPGYPQTVSLAAYQRNVSPNNSVSLTQSNLSFSSYFGENETTPPGRSLPDANVENARRNLMGSFRSVFTNQTEQSDGNSVKGGHNVIESTDNPQAVEVNAYPEILGIPRTQGRLKLDVAKENSPTVSPNWEMMYKMTSDPRGLCLIINNRYFSGHLKERLGTDVDRDNLYMLYSLLGFNICIQENLNALEMLYTLHAFAQLPEHEKLDCCVVALLTHGLDGQVYGVDGKLINLNEIFGYFDGDAASGLKGKPKFFLIQACRGEKCDAGFDMTDSGSNGTNTSQVIMNMQAQEQRDIDQLSRRLPSGSDFLIAYATVPGFVSWRNSEQGSWFVEAFCEVFSKRCRQDDVINMLVEVNNKVATIYESATKHKQMPSPVVLLRKKLYFFPPVKL